MDETTSQSEVSNFRITDSNHHQLNGVFQRTTSNFNWMEIHDRQQLSALLKRLSCHSHDKVTQYRKRKSKEDKFHSTALTVVECATKTHWLLQRLTSYWKLNVSSIKPRKSLPGGEIILHGISSGIRDTKIKWESTKHQFKQFENAKLTIPHDIRELNQLICSMGDRDSDDGDTRYGSDNEEGDQSHSPLCDNPVCDNPLDNRLATPCHSDQDKASKPNDDEFHSSKSNPLEPSADLPDVHREVPIQPCFDTPLDHHTRNYQNRSVNSTGGVSQTFSMEHLYLIGGGIVILIGMLIIACWIRTKLRAKRARHNLEYTTHQIKLQAITTIPVLDHKARRRILGNHFDNHCVNVELELVAVEKEGQDRSDIEGDTILVNTEPQRVLQEKESVANDRCGEDFEHRLENSGAVEDVVMDDIVGAMETDHGNNQEG